MVVVATFEVSISIFQVTGKINERRIYFLVIMVQKRQSTKKDTLLQQELRGMKVKKLKMKTKMKRKK